MTDNKKEIIVKKEDAVFWMDGQGIWHNKHGRFQHQKIIRHFHRSIRLDEGGYHLFQDHGTAIEKVYFPYEETALFVFEVAVADELILALNTGRRLALNPEALSVKKDQLYLRVDDETAKFTERALLKLAPFIEEEKDRFFFVKDGQRWPIAHAKDNLTKDDR